MRAIVLATSLSLGLLAGCANLAPDYVRPALPVPATVDGRHAGTQVLGELEWQRVVADMRLRKTIELALSNNRDLRIAALNIEKARAQYQIERAPGFPAVNATASGNSALNGFGLVLSLLCIITGFWHQQTVGWEESKVLFTISFLMGAAHFGFYMIRVYRHAGQKEIPRQ